MLVGGHWLGAADGGKRVQVPVSVPLPRQNNDERPWQKRR